MNNLKRITTMPSMVWSRNPPKNFNESDEFLFETKKVITIPEMSLFRVQNPTIDEDGSVCVGLKLIPESLRLPEEMLTHFTLIKKIKRRITYKKIIITKTKPVVVLSDFWSKEYYHFLIESLSRLIFYKQHFDSFSVVTTYRQKSNFHQRAFELLGIEDITYLERKNFASIDECFFSTFPGPPDIHRPILIQKLSSELTKDLIFIKPFRKVYLSRQMANKRKVINNSELEADLISKGFEVVYAEELSFDQQRKLFFETSTLVTPHGAGLTNVIFMQKGTSVVELRKDSWGLLSAGVREGTRYYNTYWNLCEILGIDYYYLKCQTLNSDESAHYADLRVNLGDLEKILRYI